MILRYTKWRLLTWWQRTLIAMILTLMLAILFAFFVILMGSDPQMGAIKKAQYCLSFFPLIIVAIMGVVARVQQQIDLWDGRTAAVDDEVASS